MKNSHTSPAAEIKKLKATVKLLRNEISEKNRLLLSYERDWALKLFDDLQTIQNEYSILLKPPLVDLGVDQTLCAGEDAVLDATYPNASYLWSTGAVTPTITANATGNYSVDVTVNGCTASDAVSVTVLSANAVSGVGRR